MQDCPYCRRAPAQQWLHALSRSHRFYGIFHPSSGNGWSRVAGSRGFPEKTDAVESKRQSCKKARTQTRSMSLFIDSIILARKEAADDASALRECASRLQQHNRDLKQHIAQLDAEAVKEATAGWGTNDRKLTVSLCSRTKSQLRRCARPRAKRAVLQEIEASLLSRYPSPRPPRPYRAAPRLVSFLREHASTRRSMHTPIARVRGVVER